MCNRDVTAITGLELVNRLEAAKWQLSDRMHFGQFLAAEQLLKAIERAKKREGGIRKG